MFRRLLTTSALAALLPFPVFAQDSATPPEPPRDAQHGGDPHAGAEQEIVVTGTVKAVEGDRVVVDTVATQGDNQIIKNAEAEVQL